MIKCALIFCFASYAEASLSLLMVGDWGGHNDTDPTTPEQLEVANAMGTVGASLGVDEVFLLGDNFYSYGVNSSSSTRFNDTFEQVYPAVFGPVTQFWAIAGNHDHRQNVTAQIEYSSLSDQWNFPFFYYNKSWSWVAEDGVTARTAELLLLDTAILCGESDVYDKITGKWHTLTGSELPGPIYPEAAKAQWEWLEAALEASTADYLWVAGHYPIFSAGGDGTTPLLVAKLLPLLAAHGAHYISGHDHMFEHIVAPAFPDTNMFLAGAGKECCYGDENIHTVPPGAIKFMASGPKGSGNSVPDTFPNKGAIDGGFASFQFGDESVQVMFHMHDGQIIYTPPPVPRRVPAAK